MRATHDMRLLWLCSAAYILLTYSAFPSAVQGHLPVVSTLCDHVRSNVPQTETS